MNLSENNCLQVIQEAYADIEQGHELIERGLKKLSGGPASYYFNQQKAYHLALFKRAPAKVGDKVRLIVEIDFERAWGWRSLQEHLFKGATGIVKGVTFHEDKFRFDVEFEGFKAGDNIRLRETEIERLPE